MIPVVTIRAHRVVRITNHKLVPDRDGEKGVGDGNPLPETQNSRPGGKISLWVDWFMLSVGASFSFQSCYSDI